MSIKIKVDNVFLCKRCNTIYTKDKQAPGKKNQCAECRKEYNAALYLRSTKVRNDLKPKLKRGPKPGWKKQIQVLREDENNEIVENEIVKIEIEN